MGSAQLNKVAAKTDYDYLSNCPNNYTLENAVYGIYADENCSKLITEIRTDSQGKTQTIPMPEGIYYVKEISPSYGFKLDEVLNVIVCFHNIPSLFVLPFQSLPVGFSVFSSESH